MRKNIFEQLNDTVSFYREIHRLEGLLQKRGGVKLEIPSHLGAMFPPSEKLYPFEQFVDEMAFKTWKSRGTCVSCTDMRETLGIPNILNNPNPIEDDILTYLEYVGNLFMLFNKVKLNAGSKFYGTSITEAAHNNLMTILD